MPGWDRLGKSDAVDSGRSRQRSASPSRAVQPQSARAAGWMARGHSCAKIRSCRALAASSRTWSASSGRREDSARTMKVSSTGKEYSCLRRKVSSRALAEDLWACQGTCARGRRLKHSIRTRCAAVRPLVRSSVRLCGKPKSLCGRPGDLCARPTTCAAVRAFCAAGRRLVRAEDHLCEPQTTCAEVWHGNSVRKSTVWLGRLLARWIRLLPHSIRVPKRRGTFLKRRTACTRARELVRVVRKYLCFGSRVKEPTQQV